MLFRQRLDALIAQLDGGNISAFARRCELEDSSIRQWKKGPSLPSIEKALQLARACGVSVEWLFGGDSENSSDGKLVNIPKADFRASAGPGSLVLSQDHGSLAMPRHILERLILRPEHALALIAEGNSMAQTIGDGDLLLIDRSDDGRRRPLASGSVYALTVDDEAFVKRIYREPGRLVLHSDSGAPDIPVDDSRTVRIIGRVVWVGHAL
ncbi:XRE family transcriptional regulator [Blastochloris tepida]|uniref:XRE family transcriptional regulator n=1 Tax=Blastochloris tepida TaxID=2233851 RepID=UPI000F832CFA|nr:XRE family transcriptional regulator [Blastochloris tepida]